VISITRDGPVGASIRALGIDVEVVSLKPNLLNWFGLARRIRELRPDLVQTWLYHADVLGGLAARRAGAPRVIWGVRHSNLEPDSNERSVLFLARWAARISRRVPDRILFNSETALRAHVGIGYDAARTEVVPNGFDTARFRPDPASRQALRAELGLAADTPLVGLVARFHPQKDHATFFSAARRVAERVSGVRFVLCGRGVNAENGMLRRWTDANGLGGRVHLLGVRDDMPALQAALDVAVSSSVGEEAFPNAVGEAMACAVPCVATDVGDTRLLVGDAGRIVPRRDPVALADACVALFAAAEARQRIGLAARDRIERHFSLPAIARRYEAIYSGAA
jgi:glycosyltransferase involved in cell wall biosynthesis